ncbi:MAG: RecX family transcriptional regulator [Chloroflexi bacterium]|nr:RecX family transcriptional regulator [Chloroflexota bacterium]
MSVYIDDEFAFGLSRQVAGWLSTGQELSDEKILELQEVETREKAYQRALNFLSYRPRSEAEVRRNLIKHDTPEDCIEETLERLRDLDLVSDQQFAETWVENRSTFRPRGRRALFSELRAKGIHNKTIDVVLQDLDEDDLAYRAAQKKVRQYRGLAWPEFKKKMLGFLARRGFNYSVAAPVIEKVWSENQPDPADKYNT